MGEEKKKLVYEIDPSKVIIDDEIEDKHIKYDDINEKFIMNEKEFKKLIKRQYKHENKSKDNTSPEILKRISV